MSEKSNDIPWDGSEAPDGLTSALSDRSLSNPVIVSDLVAGFVEHVRDLLISAHSQEIDNDQLVAGIKTASSNLGTVFAGLVPGWPATTWNTQEMGGLKSRAKALIASSSVNFGIDANFDESNPISGLFYLLSYQIVAAYRAVYTGEESVDLPSAMRYLSATLIGSPIPLEDAE
jgi:hypothetical protein